MKVRGVLGSYEFRNVNANEMAFKSITESLVQDANGVWVHKNGDSLETAVKNFLETEENSFLLKTKKSSGPGLDTDIKDDTSTSSKGKSLRDLPVAEVLKLAEGGNLRNR